MNFRPRASELTELSVTPLIDVVLLLLIFFMVSTTFDHDSEMNVTLPEASKEITQAKPDAINIAIDSQSRVYVNKRELVNAQIGTIKEALYDSLAELEDPPVIISADRDTPYQLVIRAMDAARQLELVKITFATSIEETDY